MGARALPIQPLGTADRLTTGYQPDAKDCELTCGRKGEKQTPFIGLASIQRGSPTLPASQRERVEAYADAVTRAGGVPVALICFGPSPGEEIVDRLDGLVLMGGGDVEPAAYGAKDNAAVGVDPERDRFELELVRAAIDVNRPILAVCRGVQVLNVAFGGTLHQDLPALNDLNPHTGRIEGQSVDGVLHEVNLLRGSRTAKATGRNAVIGWSSHHQGIDRLGTGLRPVGWTPDGLIEAVEGDEGWVVGVQWHPETTAHSDPVEQAIYDALVIQALEFVDCREAL